MSAYLLSDFAKQELDDIWDYYYENVSEAEANRRIAYFSDRFDLLAEYPRMGKARPEFAQGIRSHVVLPYIIWYYVRPNQIEIFRIVHGSRDASFLFGDAP